MLDEAKMRRLAMIQYTYTMAVDQCQKPEPLNMVALLLFHDAVELFLMLASEHLHAGKTGKDFLAYWEPINQKLPTHDFGHKDSMGRLSAARANWKHHGIRLSTTEIEDFRTNVADFFRDNTPKIFGIAFEAISMVMLVQTEEVRNRLVEAERLSSEGEIKAALREMAIAFQDLLHRFDWSAREQNSPHTAGLTRRIFSRIEGAAPRQLSRFAEAIEKELTDLHEQVKLLSIGIDYRSYVRFRGLTPTAYLIMDGHYETADTGRGQSHQEYLFCYHFVIECALRLQEIQFS